MFSAAIQLLIIISGIVGGWWIGSHRAYMHKWGFLIQALRQLPLVVLYYTGNQWLMCVAAIIYGVLWARSTKNNWRTQK